MNHIREADRWLHQGVQIEVTDWQMSAAALQIVYFFHQGGSICYRDSGPFTGAYLQFHQPLANGVPAADYHNVFVHYMGEEITGRIGPVVVEVFKPLHASEVGIPQCGSAATAPVDKVRAEIISASVANLATHRSAWQRAVALLEDNARR